MPLISKQQRNLVTFTNCIFFLLHGHPQQFKDRILWNERNNEKLKCMNRELVNFRHLHIERFCFICVLVQDTQPHEADFHPCKISLKMPIALREEFGETVWVKCFRRGCYVLPPSHYHDYPRKLSAMLTLFQTSKLVLFTRWNCIWFLPTLNTCWPWLNTNPDIEITSVRTLRLPR